MKKLSLLPLILLFICACSGLKKMTNEAFYYGVVGQKEQNVYTRVGFPSSTYFADDGRKVLVYEIPEIEFKGYSKNIEPGIIPFIDYRGKRDYDVDIVRMTDAGSDARTFANYDSRMTDLKIYIDENGICNQVDHNLSKAQLNYFYDRLKRYIPED